MGATVLGMPTATVTNGTLVLIHPVSLHGGAGSPPGPSRRLVKFSREEHAPHHAPRLQLATPEYYRTRDDDGGAGIRDELEARYREDRSEVLTDRGLGGVVRVAPRADLAATFGVSGLWLYCASLRPDGPAGTESVRRRFGAEAVTELGEPAAFAEALGDAVARDLRAEVVSDAGSLSAVLQRLMLHGWSSQAARARGANGPDIGNVVWVDHGAVVYSDGANRLLDGIEERERPRALPFIKRSRYAWQREYRFVVSTIGTPREAVYRVPNTQPLRGLTSPWAGPARGRPGR